MKTGKCKFDLIDFLFPAFHEFDCSVAALFCKQQICTPVEAASESMAA